MHPHDLEDDLVAVARVHLAAAPHFLSLRALAADVGVTSDGLERALGLLGFGLRELEWQARYEPRCTFRSHAKLGCIKVEAPRGPRSAPALLALQERTAPHLRRAALADIFPPLIERIKRGEVAVPGPDLLKIQRTYSPIYRPDELPPELLPDARPAPLLEGLAPRPPAAPPSPRLPSPERKAEPAPRLDEPSPHSGEPSPRLDEPSSRLELDEPDLPLDGVTMEPFVALDVETTGFGAEDRVIWVALVSFDETGSPVHIWDTPINPRMKIPAKVQELTGITPAELAKAPRFEDVAHQLHQRLTGQVVVAHNLPFDKRMLTAEFERLSKLGSAFEVFGDICRWPETKREGCTQALARKELPKGAKLSLDEVAKHYGVKMGKHHRAVGDATVCGRILVKMAHAKAKGM